MVGSLMLTATNLLPSWMVKELGSQPAFGKIIDKSTGTYFYSQWPTALVF